MTKSPGPDSKLSNAHKLASRRIPIAIVIGLTLLSGAVHGYLDGRWSQPADLVKVGQSFENLPQKCGDWVLEDTSDLAPSAEKLLRCYGSTVRVYRNDATGALINVALLVGPRGPIAVHVPEICFSSVGTKQFDERQIETISSATERDQFWSVQFVKDADPEPSTDVWYGWSDGGTWQAREHPRFWLTESLYKIQVAGPAVEEGSTRPCREFLEAFLPHVKQVMDQ